MKSSRLQWYWHRLRAMRLAEMAGHARKKLFQFADGLRERDWGSVKLESSGAFPRLPPHDQAPEELRTALRRDADDILRGHWKAFGHLELQVDDPPKWHCDYLVGKDLATTRSAFKLNHRALPEGADIKLIWELSRWHQLTRLAQAAYVLGDEHAARKCVAWLEDWVTHNPPYRGWNWTSALEAGLRLVQFTWMDALLGQPLTRPSGTLSPSEGERDGVRGRANAEPSEGGTTNNELDTLRYEILPAHVWFAWRHKSFGSSANNHLLGELTGLILATARWPALERWGAPIEELQRRWEHEVLAQFAEDGGNKEQALHYHLFSWELGWQARAALAAAGRKIASPVEERLNSAASFLRDVQVRHDPWDYGDSDSAFVTPFFASEKTATREWCDWLDQLTTSRSLHYWLGESPVSPPAGRMKQPRQTVSLEPWWIYEKSGMALCEFGFWFLRWDLSPLGYLKTAAHGHLDALHLSIWFKGVAMVIDPGTGCYYADRELRSWLASRAAHNGPCPAGQEHPKRLGPFLWAEHHERPTWWNALTHKPGTGGVTGELRLPGGILRRSVKRLEDGDGWELMDAFEAKTGVSAEFTERWQFAPGAFVKMLGQRRFLVKRGDVSITVEVGAEWTEVELVERRSDDAVGTGPGPGRGDVAKTCNNCSTISPYPEEWLAGLVSPAFRQVEWAPFLKLVARPGNGPCVFRTTFLASARS